MNRVHSKPISIEVDGIPFTSVGMYYEGNRKAVCHAIKEGRHDAIEYAAREMAPLVPRNSILIPTPSHHGDARETKELCECISRITGTPVVDALRGNDRRSQYYAKHEGNPVTEKEMGFRRVCALPLGKTPIIIDAVSDLGTSAKAAVHALQRGSSFVPTPNVITFAVTDNLLQQAQENRLSTSFKR